MGSFISYNKINSLEETYFIAGTDFTLEFVTYEEDGVTPLDLSGASINWVLCPYGQPTYAILQLSATITDTNKFEVIVPADETVSFNGKFIQQPVITDFAGITFRPAQGVILIAPAIPVV